MTFLAFSNSVLFPRLLALISPNTQEFLLKNLRINLREKSISSNLYYENNNNLKQEFLILTKVSWAVRPTTAKEPRREGSSGSLTCGGGGDLHLVSWLAGLRRGVWNTSGRNRTCDCDPPHWKCAPDALPLSYTCPQPKKGKGINLPVLHMSSWQVQHSDI
jgi:hypothetical protein